MTDTERKSRIQQALSESDWDAVICALPSDVLLLTGYWPVIGASVAICFREGPTILLVPEDEKEIAEGGFADSIVTFAAETLEEMQSVTDAVKPLLTGVLQRLHAGRGTIGVESASNSQAASYLAIHLFGNNLAEAVRVALPRATLTPCEGWIRDLKSLKTRFEIEKIRTACGIARNSFETGASRLRVGMDEPAAAELFRAPLQSAKPGPRNFVRSDGFAFCMSGPNAAKASAAYARTRHRKLEPDDTVMIHCNSYVDGFWTDITRTYTFQPFDERQQRIRTAVLAARNAALECIKPGTRAADVDAASRKTITGLGLAEYLRHGTGHGVGFSPMSAYSIPQLHVKSPDVLREGMVFNVEPAVYVSGYGGIRHCDMVAVTATGTNFSRIFSPTLPPSRCPAPMAGKSSWLKRPQNHEHGQNTNRPVSRRGSMAKNVSDILVERLIGWGVDTIFGFPGDGVNGIFEALRTHQEKIRFIQVRHEEAAAFAAVGYAKYSGRLGVCIATSGPGGVHLLNGLYDAKCDGQPVLAITGHTFHDLIGTHYQQDVDLDKLYMDVAAFNQRIMGPGHVTNIVDEAIKTSLTRRGVSHITIPKDIQDWTSRDEERSKANVPKHSADMYAASHPVPPVELLQSAADLINRGTKVAILAGAGCLKARAEILRLAELTAAPIVKPLLGKAVVPDNSPYTTGGIGLLGTAPSQEALKECETLIIAGSGFPYMEFYPKPGQAKTIQIDIDPARIGLRHPVDVGLVGECSSVLRALLPLIREKQDRSFLEEAQKSMKSWNQLMEVRGTRKDMPMKPQVVTWNLNKLLDDDAIVSSDSGTIATWSARYIEMRGDMKFSLSGSLATMANGLPYSIGAAVAFPGRQVVCIVGDGGLTMLMGEIATLVKYKLPVKVIVIKNNVLGQIKWEQMVMEGNPEYGVELEPIDFAAVAKACGAAGYTIEDPGQAASILREALAHDGPAVVQAVVDPNEPPTPGNISSEQAFKFAESLVRGEKNGWKIFKSVLGDKVREVI